MPENVNGNTDPNLDLDSDLDALNTPLQKLGWVPMVNDHTASNQNEQGDRILPEKHTGNHCA